MADCSQFDIQYQNYLNQYNAINASLAVTRNDGITRAKQYDISGAEDANIQLRDFLSQLYILIDKIGKTAFQAGKAGCSASESKLDDLQDNATDLEDRVQDAINDVDDAIDDAAIAKEEAEEAAAQKQQDQLDQLEEVEITATKKEPTPIEDPNELQEVTVTGKKAPNPVEPPEGTTAADPADELTEVTVTGTRNTNVGIPPNVKKTQAQSTLQDTTNFKQKKDWRFRLSLSPGATYLYKDKNNKLLSILNDTDGIIFPYTPSVSVTYAANYDGVNPTHSNYKIYNYTNSNVDNINITCDFTAQDTYEANYLLAVIHFLRSATKMFYGKDENPKAGTPPPLCYLFGFGQYQFNAHPVVINNFTYTLPTDVDYIRAGAITTSPGESKASEQPKSASKAKGWGEIAQDYIQGRLEQGIAKIGNSIGLSLSPGGGTGGPVFGGESGFNSQIPPGTVDPTYVPTKINISFNCLPIVSRYQNSTQFSLKEYANGTLLAGTKRPGGGIW